MTATSNFDTASGWGSGTRRFARKAKPRTPAAQAAADEIDEMIARISLADRKAFSQLYDCTSSKLFGVCLRVLKNRAAAEDALQETYMKVWRYAGNYQSGGISPMTWLITIARNTSIDRLRATRQSEDISGMDDSLASPGLTPEQSVIAGGEATRIAVCLAALDDPRDRAVRGAYLEGRSYAELAETLNVPLNTVRTWLRRSLISLKECMSK
jgi:RNA polymerase sigma-70 factor (ECF subfamily)